MGFDKDKIEELAGEYPVVEGQKNYEQELRLLQSLPQKYENGNWGMNDLLDIMDWMRSALKNHFSENSSEDVQQALEQVRDTTDVQEKVEILDDLYGVGVSVASAILLFTEPEEYVVMTGPSVKALQDEGYSLPAPSDDFTSSDYVHYVELCRVIAEREDVSLRKLDRALVVAGKK